MVDSPKTLQVEAMSNLHAGGEVWLDAMRSAVKACSALWCHAATYRRLGWFPTQEEYAEDWELSDRTVQRQWQLIRRAFPGETSPQRLVSWLVLRTLPDSEDAREALFLEPPPQTFGER
jgi:hypothetical protein